MLDQTGALAVTVMGRVESGGARDWRRAPDAAMGMPRLGRA
ncbi:hypothetical protein ABC383_17830 [Noviherbaspirillum sp. 1P10PC]